MCLSAEQNYTQKLEELIQEKTKCNIWNREEYEEIIHLISTEPKNVDKTNFYYYIIKKYEVLQCGDVTKIMQRRKSHDDEIKYLVCLEDMYCVAKTIHFDVGHGGRDKMIKEANKKYANVSIEALELLKEQCEEYQLKKRRTASKGSCQTHHK